MDTMRIVDAAIATPQERECETLASSIEEAKQLAPWAADVVEISGGWLAFRREDELERWKAQQ